MSRWVMLCFVCLFVSSCKGRKNGYGEDCVVPIYQHSLQWLGNPSTLPPPKDVRHVTDRSVPIPERIKKFRGGRNIWTFWDGGYRDLATFNKLNIQTWQKMMGEEWKIHVLSLDPDDPDFLYHWLDWDTFVPTFRSFDPIVKSDHIRLALLETYGGIWMDSTVILLRSLEEACQMNWDETGSSTRMCGFYYHAKGMSHLDMTDYFENWLIMVRHDSPFLAAWRKQFSKYWADRTKSTSIRTYPDYAAYDLENIGGVDYLTQHVAFRHILESSPSLRAEYQNHTHLFRADTEGFGHTRDSGWWSVDNFNFFMLSDDAKKARALRHDQVVLKFTGGSSLCIRALSEDSFLSRETTLTRLYKSILYP